MNAPLNTVGARFARRLTKEADAITQGVLRLTRDTGWDVNERKIRGCLPHDLTDADGWHLVNTLEALQLPIRIERGAPPSGNRYPVLCIAGEAHWSIWPADGPIPRHRNNYYVCVEDVDHAERRPFSTDRKDLLKALRSSILSLMTTTLVINLLGVSTVVFVIMIYNYAVAARSLSVLSAIIVGLILFVALEVVARYMRSAVMARVAANLEHQMGLMLLHKLVSLPLNAFAGSDAIQQRTRLRQFENIRDTMLGNTGQSLLDLPFMLLYLVIIAILSPLVGAALLCMTLLCAGVFSILQPKLRQLSAETVRTSTGFRRLASEVIENQSAIRSLQTVPIWKNRLEDAHSAHLDSSAAAQRFSQRCSVLLNAMILATGTICGLLSTYLAITDSLSLGTLIGMVVLIWRFLMPLQSVAQSTEQLAGFWESMRQFSEAFQISSESFRGLAPIVGEKVDPPVIFDQVTLRFSDSIVPPLLGVSLRLDHGMILSVSGIHMAGKTKLAEMIAGLYLPTGGQILINNTDVRQIPVDDLREAIAFSPQQPRLFYGSIAQNFDFAAPGATEDMMWGALLEAGIDTFVRKLPEGLATRLSTDVFKDLPFGVQKGLALAQTFLKPGPIFIFDQPVYGIDPDQQVFVRAAIQARRARGAVLIISNEPRDLDIADRHILMENGRVIINDRAARARPKIEAFLARQAA